MEINNSWINKDINNEVVIKYTWLLYDFGKQKKNTNAIIGNVSESKG